MSEVVNYDKLEIHFDKDFLLYKELENLREINQRNFVILDRLCKKIDVAKRVLKIYDKDFLTKKESQQELNEEEYLILGEILLLWAKEKKEYKFLNSCLKLADLLAGEAELSLKAEKVLEEWL
ncbi:hypothetical protein [uncultured Helicobacter sp.]|uniref:hypothetical protein n=1 Tax=uncultured Helicobacter sp. TaxID=175537 RepID=UPI00261C60A9|nr:hypothetical protein [uncultured Helicobacter sp.]